MGSGEDLGSAPERLWVSEEEILKGRRICTRRLGWWHRSRVVLQDLRASGQKIPLAILWCYFLRYFSC